MHELSVCQQIIIQVNEIALQHQAIAVDSISLQIGPLSGIESTLLIQAFPFAAAQTIAANAELIIEEMPVVILCKKCGSETSATPNKLLCSQCGDCHTQLLSGDEMLLVNVELSTETVKDETLKEINYV